MGSFHSSVEEQADVLLQDIDVEAIARRISTAPLLALLELVLTCGMFCKLKENCVMQIMQLRKDQQSVMMSSIQRIKAKHQKPKSSSNAQSSASSSMSMTDLKERYVALKQAKEHTSSQLQQAQKSNLALTDRNNELVTLVTQLEEQLASLTVDYKQVKTQFDVLAEKKMQEDQKVSGDGLDLASPLRFMASSKVAVEENSQLRATVSTQEKTISTLQTQLSALSPYVSKVRELEDEIEMLKEKSRSADQVDRVTRKLEAKTTELTNALMKSKKLEEALEQAQKTSAEHETVARQVPQLKAKLDQYKNEMVSLHSKLADASSSRDSNAEIAVLQEKVQSYALQCEQHASIVADLEREKHSLLQALRVKPAARDSSASSAASGAKPSLAAEARGSLQGFVNKNVKSSEAQAQLEKELSAAKEAMETVKMDLEDQLDTMTRLKEKFQSDYIATSEQLRTANAEIVDIGHQVKTLNESLAKQREENIALSAERDTMQGTISELKAQNGQLEAKVGVMDTKIGSLEAVNTDLESQLQNSMSAIAKAQEERDSLQTSVTDLKSKFVELEAANGALESQVKAGESKLTEICGARDAEKESLNARLAQIQADLDQSYAISERLASETELMKAELREAQNRLEELSTENAAQQDQIQAFTAEMDEIKHEKAQLEGEIANMEMERSGLEETLQEFMNRELAAVESSLSLQNEVENLNSLIESRDAELTTMQQELEKAKANEELISVITALRTQLITQQKVIKAQKEETAAIIVSYHRLGMELLQYKIGGIPEPQLPTTTTFAPLSPLRRVATQKSAVRASPKSNKTGLKVTSPNRKLTPSKQLPLREKQMNHMFNQGLQIPSGTDCAVKPRRLTMAQRALETRPRTSLAATAIAKR